MDKQWYTNIHENGYGAVPYGKKKKVRVVDLIRRLKQWEDGRIEEQFPYSLLVPTFWREEEKDKKYTFTGIWDIDFKGDGREYKEEDLIEVAALSRYPCWFSGSKGIRIIAYTENLDELRDKYIVPTQNLEEYKLSEKGKEAYLSQVPKSHVVYLDDLRFEGKGIKYDFLPHPKTKKMPKLAEVWSHRSIAWYYSQLLENILEVLCSPGLPLPMERVSCVGHKRLQRQRKQQVHKKVTTKGGENIIQSFMRSEFGVGVEPGEITIMNKLDTKIICIGGPGREGKRCPIHDKVHREYGTKKLQYRVLVEGETWYSLSVMCFSSRPSAYDDALIVRIDHDSITALHDIFFDSLTQDSADYIKTSALVKTVHTRHLPSSLFYENEEFSHGGVYLVSSTMGSGKTTAVKGLISEKRPKRILWISMRLTFSMSLSETGDGPLSGFQCYKHFTTREGIRTAEKLVISPESLWKLCQESEDGTQTSLPSYDLVVVDEWNSFLLNIASTTLAKDTRRTYCLEIMKHLILRGAKYVVLTDAFIGEQEVAFLRDIHLPSERLRFIYNSCFDCDQNRYLLYDPVHSAGAWFDAIANRVDEGKKLVFVSTSREKLFGIIESQVAERRGGKGICILTGDSEMAEKQRVCMDLNEVLTDYLYFGYTPTMTVGNSFDVEDWFDDIFVFVTDTVALETLIQMMRRIRKTRSNNIHILYSTQNLYTHPYGYLSEKQEKEEEEEEEEISLERLVRTLKHRGRKDSIVKEIKFYMQQKKNDTIANMITIVPAKTKRVFKDVDPASLTKEREKIAYEKARKKKSKYVDLCTHIYRTLDSIYNKKKKKKIVEEEEDADFKLKAYIRSVLCKMLSTHSKRRTDYLATYLRKSVGKSLQLVTSWSPKTSKKNSKRAMEDLKQFSSAIASDFFRDKVDGSITKTLVPNTGNKEEIYNETVRKLENLGGAPMTVVQTESFTNFLDSIDPRYYMGNTSFNGFEYILTRQLPVGPLPLPEHIYTDIVFPILDMEEEGGLEKLKSLSSEGEKKMSTIFSKKGDDIWEIIRISSGFNPPAKLKVLRHSKNWIRRFYYILFKAGLPVTCSEKNSRTHSRYIEYYMDSVQFNILREYHQLLRGKLDPLKLVGSLTGLQW